MKDKTTVAIVVIAGLGALLYGVAGKDKPQPQPSAPELAPEVWHRGAKITLEKRANRWKWAIVAVPLGFNSGNSAFTDSGEDASYDEALDSAKSSIDAVI